MEVVALLLSAVLVTLILMTFVSDRVIEVFSETFGLALVILVVLLI